MFADEPGSISLTHSDGQTVGHLWEHLVRVIKVQCSAQSGDEKDHGSVTRHEWLQNKTSLQDEPNTPLQSWRSSSDRSSKVQRSGSSGCTAPTFLLTFLSCWLPAELISPDSVAWITPEKYFHFQTAVLTECVKKMWNRLSGHPPVLTSSSTSSLLFSPPQSPAEWALLCPVRISHNVAPPQMPYMGVQTMWSDINQSHLWTNWEWLEWQTMD